jgi:hypothetical protein
MGVWRCVRQLVRPAMHLQPKSRVRVSEHAYGEVASTDEPAVVSPGSVYLGNQATDVGSSTS